MLCKGAGEEACLLHCRIYSERKKALRKRILSKKAPTVCKMFVLPAICNSQNLRLKCWLPVWLKEALQTVLKPPGRFLGFKLDSGCVFKSSRWPEWTEKEGARHFKTPIFKNWISQKMLSPNFAVHMHLAWSAALGVHVVPSGNHLASFCKKKNLA